MALTEDYLINTAINELGYLEKNTNSSLDNKTSNAGYKNYTKYWRDMCPSLQGQAWCDCFVSWCFNKTYGSVKANELLYGGLRSYYTPTSAKCYLTKGRLDKNPKRGDQIFFSKNGSVDSIYHTGIVESFDGSYINTIEGNTSVGSGVVPNGGGVFRKRYSYAVYKNRIFCGHPKYEGGNSMAVNYAVQIKVSDYLTVRTSPGTENPIFKVNGMYELRLPSGLVVAIVEEKDGWGRLSNISGWIKLAYTKRLN